MQKTVVATYTSNVFRLGVPTLLGILLLVRLGAMIVVPLMDTTEARYGEIGRKMAELNDWVTPWFDYGVPYWGKPPLSFWLTAISFNLFGVSEFAARLPHLIVSLAIIGLTAWTAYRRVPESVWPVIVVISAAPVFFVASGMVMTDAALILGTTCAMSGFWIALDTPKVPAPGYRSRVYIPRLSSLLFFSGLVIGLLAKGPVGVALIGVPLFLWIALNRRWHDVWHGLPWIRGLLLTILISLPWYIAAEQSTPGFLRYFLVGENFLRFVTPGWLGDRYGNAHDSPIGAIWIFAFVGLLPWSVLIPIAASRWRSHGTTLSKALLTNAKTVTANLWRGPAEADSNEKQWQRYLLLWALTPLLLFTTARNVGLNYLLPAVPATAILAGQWLVAKARQGQDINRILCAGMVLTLIMMFGAAVVWSRPATMEEKSAKALLAAYEKSMTERAALSAPHQGLTKSQKSVAPLIFVRRRPFSAQFYTRGQAVLVADVNEAWSRVGAGAAYIGIHDGDAFVSAATAVNRSVQRIGRYGKFDLMFVEAR